jgi:thiol-disulfide isomerase/thioredoxin
MRQLLGCLVVAATCASWLVPARAQDDSAPRSAEAILKEIDSLERPRPDPEALKDREAAQKFSLSLLEFEKKKAGLVTELYRSHPDEPRALELLRQKWASPYIIVMSKPDELIAEADRVLDTVKDEKLKVEAHFLKARMKMNRNADGEMAPDAMDAVEAFARAAPATDARPAGLLYTLTYAEKDDAKKVAIEDRILKDYPESSYVSRINAVRKQREAIGKPIELEFNDAISGDTVSIKGLKGKVVVLDFWATWCGPCVAEMPKMKKLYAEFHDKGVEFIGVSLDKSEADGGLAALKKFVADNDIAWPQYFQGNYWQGEFSTKWGIRAIPALFVVDQEGNLFSVEARGKLDTMIPALLSKKTPATDER